MIGRVTAFVVLLALGFLALWLATGRESMAKLGSHAIEKASSPEQRAPRVAVAAGGDLGTEVLVGIRGRVSVSKTEKVVRADGLTIEVPRYTVDATDSRPLPDGRLELIDVKVQFFEVHGEEAALVGTLTASRGWVELGEDERGQRSIAMEKDIELRDAVLQSAPNARVSDATMTVSHAFARATDEAVWLRTAQPDLPFSLVIADRGRMELSGHGLQAKVPLAEDGEPAPTEPITIDVGGQPQLHHVAESGAASTLTAHGPLHYREDATGLVHVTTSDDVRVRGLLDQAGGEPLEAFGEALTATLVRSNGGSGQQASWRDVELTGSPAGLRAKGMELQCASLHGVPSALGVPCQFTARGKPVLTQTVDGRTLTFRAEDRIHLVRLQEHWQPWLAPLGFDRAAFAPIVGELLMFRGRSEATVPYENGTLTMTASDGLRVLREPGAGGALAVHGLGVVHIDPTPGADRTDDDEGALHVASQDGFRLHADAAGQTIRIGGPDAPVPFDLRTSQARASGTGAATMWRPAGTDGEATLHLVSETADVTLAMQDGSGTLRRVAELRGSFTQQGLRSLDAHGPASTFDWRAGEEQVTGHADHIEMRDADHLVLTGSPAQVDASARGGTVEGQRVEIVRLTPNAAVMHATGAAHLLRKADGDDGAPLDLTADDLVVRPFLVPDPAWFAVQLHLPPLERALWEAHAQRLSQRHLIARGDVAITQQTGDDADAAQAWGDRLVLRIADPDAVGLLTGAPAGLTRNDARQSLRGEARQIALRRVGTDEHLELRPVDGRGPLLVLTSHGEGQSPFGSAGGSTRIRSAGVMRADPAAIVIEGPVIVDSLDAHGDEDRDGLTLHADAMRMERDEHGEVTSVQADGAGNLHWRGIVARAQHLGLDLQTHRCHVRDPDVAVVRLPNGVVWRCAEAEFDYRTYEGTTWRSVVSRDSP